MNGGAMVRRLVFEIGGRAAKAEVALDVSPARIGSNPRASIVLNDPMVHPVHAVIEWDELAVRIKDRSGAGVAVNGAPVSETEIKNGDVVRVGESTITVRWVAPTSSPRPASSPRPPPIPTEAPAPPQTVRPAPNPVSIGGVVLPPIKGALPELELKPSALPVRPELVRGAPTDAPEMALPVEFTFDNYYDVLGLSRSATGTRCAMPRPRSSSAPARRPRRRIRRPGGSPSSPTRPRRPSPPKWRSARSTTAWRRPASSPCRTRSSRGRLSGATR